MIIEKIATSLKNDNSVVKSFWLSFWSRANSKTHSEFSSDSELIQNCTLNFLLIQRNSEDIDSEFCSDSEKFQNQYRNYSENVLNQYWKLNLFWKWSDSVLMLTEWKVRVMSWFFTINSIKLWCHLFNFSCLIFSCWCCELWLLQLWLVLLYLTNFISSPLVWVTI